MGLWLGFDTSNYRTSAALYDAQTDEGQNLGSLLPVPQGTRGLRQSDAVFAHVRALPSIVERLIPADGAQVCAVGASVSPRAQEDSYMPCFLVGETAARVTAAVLGVPFYPCSHQQGHIAAAAHSARALSLLEKPHLAWHLSGGTTELLCVEPAQTGLFSCSVLGGTTDISAGQLIDRTGVRLGLSFPAGPALEELAKQSLDGADFFRVRVQDCRFSLSGIENRLMALEAGGGAPADIAAYTIRTVQYAVRCATEQAIRKYPGLPVLCAGGVMANRAIAQDMRARFGAHIASGEMSGDNALGVAILASLLGEGRA